MPIPDFWNDTSKTRFFLAGIIQGSLPDSIHNQDYRRRLRRVLTDAFPEAVVYCPIDNHPDSLDYTYQQGRQCYLDHIDMAGSATALIAFVPQASMGTAAEMWECYRNSIPIIAISPMTENWTIKFLSSAVLEDLGAFEKFVKDGSMARLIGQHSSGTTP